MATGPLFAPEPAHTLAQQSQDRGGGTDLRVPPSIGSRAGDGGSPPISRRRRGLQGNQEHWLALLI
jgi:hypothetical protein